MSSIPVIRKSIWSKRPVRLMVIGTVIGGTLQIICTQSIKNHPEFFEDKDVKKLLSESPRGGDIKTKIITGLLNIDEVSIGKLLIKVTAKAGATIALVGEASSKQIAKVFRSLDRSRLKHYLLLVDN